MTTTLIHATLFSTTQPPTLHSSWTVALYPTLRCQFRIFHRVNIRRVQFLATPLCIPNTNVVSRAQYRPFASKMVSSVPRVSPSCMQHSANLPTCLSTHLTTTQVLERKECKAVTYALCNQPVNMVAVRNSHARRQPPWNGTGATTSRRNGVGTGHYGRFLKKKNVKSKNFHCAQGKLTTNCA